MRTRIVASLAALGIACTLPAALSAQVGIGVKVGTMGLGPELSVAAGNRFALRGGMGFIPVEPTMTSSDIKYTLHPPSGAWHAGVDFYPGLGSLRLSGGLMHWPEYDLTASQTGSTEIGGQTYNGTVTLKAAVTNATSTAPFFSIGLGRTAKRGFGMFMDLGVALIGEADIDLTGTCVLSNGSPCPGNFQADLKAEEADLQADAGKYLDLLPIFQIGFRLGVGGAR